MSDMEPPMSDDLKPRPFCGSDAENYYYKNTTCCTNEHCDFSDKIMEKPIRIQRKRTKGWRMPHNTVYVGRPTKWGNPYNDPLGNQNTELHQFQAFICLSLNGHHLANEARKELRGKNLACWCKIGSPCHADYLLEIANK